MIRRPFRWRNRYTTAPTGHSTAAAAANARNPTVGPTTLHRHGLLLAPHSTHKGAAIAMSSRFYDSPVILKAKRTSSVPFRPTPMFPYYRSHVAGRVF
ncbi:hypothetical protein ZIOFF_032614 [Zingiber officinale]|uniref:Uncharacterized protein n=1 Tax=Zingiber officinale TaxID=94328 RepID=A0A8J5GGS4_ZINOF|nr:hypothetical protein ZIOFF_032614 [Zingiber officinale]